MLSIIVWTNTCSAVSQSNMTKVGPITFYFKKAFTASYMVSYRMSHKKGIDKKLLFGAAQGFNLQFLNLFGFSISVSFVWCII